MPQLRVGPWSLNDDGKVRFLVIGVSGANYYAHSEATLFATQDRDLFLPLEPGNLRTAWAICESQGFRSGSPVHPLLAHTT